MHKGPSAPSPLRKAGLNYQEVCDCLETCQLQQLTRPQMQAPPQPTQPLMPRNSIVPPSPLPSDYPETIAPSRLRGTRSGTLNPTRPTRQPSHAIKSAFSLRETLHMHGADATRTGSDRTHDLSVKAECSNYYTNFWMKGSNTELNCNLCGHHHNPVGILLFPSHRSSSMSPAAAHCFYDDLHQRHILNRRQSSRKGRRYWYVSSSFAQDKASISSASTTHSAAMRHLPHNLDLTFENGRREENSLHCVRLISTLDPYLIDNPHEQLWTLSIAKGRHLHLSCLPSSGFFSNSSFRRSFIVPQFTAPISRNDFGKGSPPWPGSIRTQVF